MAGFVCPECHLRVRPAALYVSRGTSWWSVSRAEARHQDASCAHPERWSSGLIRGCPSLRRVIDPVLGLPPPVRGPSLSGQIGIEEAAHACHIVETGAAGGAAVAAEAGAAARTEATVAPAAGGAAGTTIVPIPPVAGGAFADAESREDFERMPGPRAIRWYELRDVLFDPERFILIRDGTRVAETRYRLGQRDYWRDLDPTRFIQRLETERLVVIGVNITFRNYYHWLMQCLPSIETAVNAVGAANCVLALPALSRYQEDSLALLGFDGIPRARIDFDRYYAFRSVHYCELLSGVAEDHVSPFCLGVLERMAAGIAPAADAPTRLYVSRLDSHNRAIRNEAAVKALLERYGFVTLAAGFIPLATQIALFRGARFVVGAHGAGLTNLAFCTPGTTVLELVQSSYPMVVMNRIAQGRGLRYHAECFDCGGEGEAEADIHKRSWAVDLDRLTAKLESLLRE